MLRDGDKKRSNPKIDNYLQKTFLNKDFCETKDGAFQFNFCPYFSTLSPAGKRKKQKKVWPQNQTETGIQIMNIDISQFFICITPEILDALSK